MTSKKIVNMIRNWQMERHIILECIADTLTGATFGRLMPFSLRLITTKRIANSPKSSRRYSEDNMTRSRLHRPQPPYWETRVWGLRLKTWRDILFVVLIVFLASQVFLRLARAERPLISPLSMTAFAGESEDPADLMIDTPEKQEIIAYVRQVFGKHADKGFKVLSCENASLNPKAVNGAGNTPEGSLDLGLWQINDYWQGVSNKRFLFDYKINTHIAWNIYEANGYTFERWTCGRKLGV